MLQRAHVLASELVVGDPGVFVIVFAVANRAYMANVHIDTWEGDFTYHAPAVDGLGDGVEQTVAQALVFYHVGLVLAQTVVTLGGGKPAPDCCGEAASGAMT